jgi:hypothetical protein
MKKMIVIFMAMIATCVVNAEDYSQVKEEIAQNENLMEPVEEAFAEEFDEEAIDKELSELLPNEQVLKDNSESAFEEENLDLEEDFTEEASQ